MELGVSETFFVTVGAITLASLLICGLYAAGLAEAKYRSYWGFFALGLLFGPIAIFVAILAAPGWGPIPDGRRLLTCPRCATRQNVMVTATKADCWQCGLTITITASAR